MSLVSKIFVGAQGISLILAATFSPAAWASGSSFSEVWATVQQGPYADLPQYQSTYDSLFDDNISLIELAARRTLSSSADTLPWFQKLVHPVGICFAGTWTITEPSPYTGYFANGSNGLIIVRASEALGSAEAGAWRAFGLAGKIFPTADATSSTAVPTANFFTVDDLGGTNASSFLALAKTNAPASSIHLSQLAIFPMLREIARTFQRADSDPGVRQVYQISELGLANAAAARTPASFGLVAESTERVRTSDFRDELQLSHYEGGLKFGIFVKDGGSWQRLGQIKLTEQALSDGCDHRLHFNHPRWK